MKRPEQLHPWNVTPGEAIAIQQLLRSKISIGHRVTLEDSIEVVMKCTRGYRIPEPTRQAHLLVNAMRRGETIPKIARPGKKPLF